MRRLPLIGSALVLPLVLPLVLAVLAVLAVAGPAAAQGTGDLAANRRKLSQIRAVLADARADLDAVAKAERAAAAELAASQAAAAAAAAELANARAERGTEAARLNAVSGQLERLRARAGLRARAMYIGGGGDALAAVVSANDPAELLDRAMRAEQAARSDADLRTELDEAGTVAADAAARLAEAEARASAAADAAGKRSAELTDAQRVRAEAKQRLAERIAGYQKDAAAIEADSARVARLLRAKGAGSGGPVSAGGLHWPVSCPRTSGFGMRWGRMHEGIDFGCPSGTAVHAAAAGTVVSAGWSSGYGYLVLIDHGAVVTAYAHNSRLLVRAGERVSSGQTVSLSGSTGHSTGPHVHFEVRVNGVARNPDNYI